MNGSHYQQQMNISWQKKIIETRSKVWQRGGGFNYSKGQTSWSNFQVYLTTYLTKDSN